jgi:hypothetical protein
VLTTYGRELSKELLSTWSGETEHFPGHGLVKAQSENLLNGGDLRWIQTRKESRRIKEGRFFYMQGDLELAYQSNGITVDASIGLDPGSPLDSDDERWVSRRHYIMASHSLGNLRLGKFTRNFGVMIPDHTSQIKRGLGWDQGSETYNIEYSRQMEQDAINLTVVTDLKTGVDRPREKGVALSYAHTFSNSFKLGSSTFFGRGEDESRRSIYGPYWNFGITEKLYFLGEWDFVESWSDGEKRPDASVAYAKMGYEIFKGFDFYILGEERDGDLGKKGKDHQSGGFGIQWSPRPHFIVTTQWQELKGRPNGSGRSSSGWMVLQYAI